MLRGTSRRLHSICTDLSCPELDYKVYCMRTLPLFPIPSSSFSLLGLFHFLLLGRELFDAVLNLVFTDELYVVQVLLRPEKAQNCHSKFFLL